DHLRRRAARGRARPGRRAAARRHHHGRQRALGARAPDAAPVRPPERDEGRARRGRGRRGDRARLPLALRLLAGELAAAAHRGVGADVAAGGVHRPRGRRARRARRARARARRRGAPHAAGRRRGAPRRRADGAQQPPHAQPVHLLRRARRDRARRAPPRARRRRGPHRPRRHHRARRAGQAVHRRLPRPRPAHPHLGRAAGVELPALADGLRRDLHLAGALARLRPGRALRGGARLPAPRPPLRPRHRL
ncbi:MAG: Undecaprenyl diphosphate synthase, partial [uncultured Gemmatimonadaceae bacterium]